MNRLDEWAFVIGNLILNFGTLDLHVFEFLQANLPPGELAEAKKRPFAVRLKKVGRLISRSPDKAAKFREFRQRLEPLRKLRTHIAHGHLFVRIDPATTQLSITIARAKDQDDSTLHGARCLSTGDVLRASTGLANLCDDFCRMADLYRSSQAPAAARVQADGGQRRH